MLFLVPRAARALQHGVSKRVLPFACIGFRWLWDSSEVLTLQGGRRVPTVLTDTKNVCGKHGSILWAWRWWSIVVDSMTPERWCIYTRCIIHECIFIATYTKDARRRYPSKIMTEHVRCFLMLQPCWGQMMVCQPTTGWRTTWGLWAMSVRFAGVTFRQSGIKEVCNELGFMNDYHQWCW